MVAVAFFLRRLIRAIEGATAQLSRLADVEEKRLKMDAFGRNFPLAMIDDLEPLTAEEIEEDRRRRPDVSTQTESDLAELDRLDRVYRERHGRAPADDEDLENLGRAEEEEPQR